MTTRRERFREVLRRLDPIATTTEAVEKGWVVTRRDGFLDQLKLAIELNSRR